MVFFEVSRIEVRKVLDWSIILAIIFIAGILSYFLGQKIGHLFPAILQRLPAQLLKPKIEEKPTEFPIPEIKLGEKISYIEVAEWGEGITHLARRALKKYLQENPQDFEVTPEHKIYIEDYLAKKMGGGWLKLGESLEFSEDLIKEGIEKAENLTPEQLENLTQYSQLVPFLNY